MTTRFLGVLSAFVLASLSFPAAASTQDDIQSCREALTAQGQINMDDYRLGFERKKGNRNRTLTLEAIPNSEGEKYEVTCVITKGDVTEVSLQKK